MSAILDKKLKALAHFLNISVDSIKFDGDPDHIRTYDNFSTIHGIFTVMDQEEMENVHLDSVEELISELGLSAFMPPFIEIIKKSYLDQTEFESICSEDYYYYASDIEKESGTYDNRLIDECVQNKLIKVLDLDSDGNYTGKLDLVDTYGDFLVERTRKDYDGNFVAWYIDQFGDDQLYDYISQNIDILDVAGISAKLIELDGPGVQLASYDGETNMCDDFYIFKQDD